MNEKKEDLKLIDCYEEDGEEISVYEYKGVKITENYMHENEFMIDDYWYTSLEDAMHSIDKKEKYNNLSAEDKKFYDEYINRNMCSIINNKCPYPSIKNCKKCEMFKIVEEVKNLSRKEREKHKKLLE